MVVLPSPRRLRRHLLQFATLAVFALAGHQASRAQQFSKIVVFGDSLSDVGNIADRVASADLIGVRYPGPDANYTDGRFTNGGDTSPKARTFFGVWHEQLAKIYLGMDAATPSEEGGDDYAFGGAKTIDGSMKRALFTDPLFDQTISSVQIDDMGKQVSDYLAKGPADGNALFAVWGGGNDLFDNPDSVTVTQTANNVGSLVTRLAQAGARIFIVPNVPPLGLVPNYKNDPNKAGQLNQASSDYRTLLNTVLDQTEADLTSQGITVTIYRLDIYAAFMHFVEQPMSWGFTNITDSSQGIAGSPNRYLFWDGIHPTTVGHAYIAAAAYTLISGKPVVVASNVMNLIRPRNPNQQAEFFITRVGEDLSTKLRVPFTLSGTATAGQEYEGGATGIRRLKVNKRYQVVDIPFVPGATPSQTETIILTLKATDSTVTTGPLSTSTVMIQGTGK